jgi:Helix-turn-helix domain
MPRGTTATLWCERFNRRGVEPCRRRVKTDPERRLGSNARRNAPPHRRGCCSWLVEARSASSRSRPGTGSCSRLGPGRVEACRQVGITRKIGYRWRAEAGGVAPIRLVVAVRSNRYLSMVERQRTAGLHRQGLSIREIARRLERSASTVSGELRRNTGERG